MALVERVHDYELPGPFPGCMREAMERFGSDKPDLRFGMELADPATCRGERVSVFKSALEAGSGQGPLCPPGRRLQPQALDDLVALAVQLGARGLAWLIKEEEGWRSPIAKFFGALLSASGAPLRRQGDLLLLPPAPGRAPAGSWGS